MKMKKTISMLVIAIIAVLMLTAILGSVQAVDAAPKKVKVTWHANGGKIGKANTKITTVKKNAKVKLLKAPTRTGYTFTGWYTKKTGGKKISSSTKIKKKVTHYALWKKNRVLNAEEKKLVGTWKNWFDDTAEWIFYSDGTCARVYVNFFNGIDSVNQRVGNYSLKNGVLTVQGQFREKFGATPSGGGTWGSWSDWGPTNYNIKFSTKDGKPCFDIGDSFSPFIKK